MRRENGGVFEHRPPMPPPADLAPLSTPAELLQWGIAPTPQGEAYRQYDAARAAWASVSWRAFGERVARFARALAALGLARGERVALLLPNTLDAVTADQAVLALGGVPVPMHAIDNPESIAYILADSAAALLGGGTKQKGQGGAAADAGAAARRRCWWRTRSNSGRRSPRRTRCRRHCATWCCASAPGPPTGARPRSSRSTSSWRAVMPRRRRRSPQRRPTMTSRRWSTPPARP